MPAIDPYGTKRITLPNVAPADDTDVRRRFLKLNNEKSGDAFTRGTAALHRRCRGP